MASIELIKNNPQVTARIPLPLKVNQSGYYPATYSIKQEGSDLIVSLENFVFLKQQGTSLDLTPFDQYLSFFVRGHKTLRCLVSNLTVKDNYIVFCTGGGIEQINMFDIYDTDRNLWFIGKLPINLSGFSIFSSDNVIYLAGGYINNEVSSKVWTLEFQLMRWPISIGWLNSFSPHQLLWSVCKKIPYINDGSSYNLLCLMALPFGK